MDSIYEYQDGVLGVQGRFLISGRDAHPESLQLITDRGLRLKIDRGQIIKLRPGAKNSLLLVTFDSLPVNWQNAIVRTWGNPPKLVFKTLFETHYIRDINAFNTYSLFKFDADDTSLNPEQIEEYTINASVLNTAKKIYDMRYKLRKELRGEVKDIWNLIAQEINRYRDIIGHTLPQNSRYLRDKYNEYLRCGYTVLISRKNKNSNARVVDSELEQLFNCMFARIEGKPSMTEISRIYEGFLAGYVEVINTDTGEVYNPKEFPRVSTSTVYNYLSKWKNKIATHAVRSGDRQKYMQRFKPYHSLKQPEFASSIISIDDRQPVFEYAKNTRMWFYNGIDLGSEAFTCWVYGKTKEGIITDFYRQMVRNYASWGLCMPAELECESNLNSSFKETFLKEGNMFQHVRIEANNARGKRIEQYYRPLRYKYEKKREGWLARPFALSEANEAGGQKKRLIPYEDIIAGCLNDIITWNNSEHSKIKGMSRWDVFLAMQHPDLKPINYHGILPHLGYKTETSVHTGIIRFRKQEFLLGIDGYIAVGEKLINYMNQVEGRDINIYWIDDIKGGVLKAHIYHNNRFICEAIPKPLYNRARIEQKPEDDVNRELMSKYVATIEGFGRRQKTKLENITVIDNRPVTIGNSFYIPGVTVPIIPEYNDNEAMVLPDVETRENQYLNTVETSFVRPLIETF